MYPRKIKRIIRKVRFRRFKRSRYYRRTGRGSSIIRRSLRRRPLRPEIKYIDLSTTATNISLRGRTTFNISPNIMTEGSSNGSRIGQEVSFRKLMIRLYLTGPQNPIPGGNSHEGYMRVILWTPRIDYTKANLYMTSNNIGILTQLDWNVLTVHKDMYVHLSHTHGRTYNVDSALNGGVPSGTPYPNQKLIQMNMAFPRKAKFPPSSVAGFTELDVDKDVMYCTILNYMEGISTYMFNSRITYTDA